MINKNKIKKMLFVAILSIFVINENVFAWTVGFNLPYTENNSKPGNPVPSKETFEYDSGNKRYQCDYNSSINQLQYVSFNSYDLDGNPVMPYTSNVNTTFPSGTWIGINVAENKSASWSVSNFDYYEIKKIYECIYTKTNYGLVTKATLYVPNSSICTSRCSAIGCYGNFSSGENGISGRCTCKKREQTGTSTESFLLDPVDYHVTVTSDSCPNKPGYTKPSIKYIGVQVEDISDMPECKTKAIDKVHGNAVSQVNKPTTEVEYITTNDYPNITKNGKITLPTSVIKGKMTEYHDQRSGDSGVVTAKFEYWPQKVCINVLTSKVTYKEKCSKENNEIEIKNKTVYDKYLKSNITFWHYFIPLNTISGSDFYLNLKPSGSKTTKYNVDACEEIMKNYSDYKNYIILGDSPNGGSIEFIGDYNTYKKNSSDYQSVKNNKGCYFTSKVNFNIEQKFYGEEKNKETNELILKGFNFYYRPIDISNPFPNGVDNTSYWYEWSKSNKKNPNLAKSFADEITYKAVNIDASKVREYNSQDGNDYPNWTNSMYTNGTSKYINTSNIIKRENPGKVYALGCGPANQDWKECDDNS